MQTLISFTLNHKKELTEEELYKLLEETCPMKVVDDELFEVSTERWDITYSQGAYFPYSRY